MFGFLQKHHKSQLQNETSATAVSVVLVECHKMIYASQSIQKMMFGQIKTTNYDLSIHARPQTILGEIKTVQRHWSLSAIPGRIFTIPAVHTSSLTTLLEDLVAGLAARGVQWASRCDWLEAPSKLNFLLASLVNKISVHWIRPVAASMPAHPCRLLTRPSVQAHPNRKYSCKQEQPFSRVGTRPSSAELFFRSKARSRNPRTCVALSSVPKQYRQLLWARV